MKIIDLHTFTGDFAENKDVARSLRLEEIEPYLKVGDTVNINFQGITSATQSFIHALISQSIRDFGIEVLDNINFKNCNDQVKTIIEIVVEYVQDGIFTDEGSEE